MIDGRAVNAEVIAFTGDNYRLEDRDLGRVPSANTTEGLLGDARPLGYTLAADRIPVPLRGPLRGMVVRYGGRAGPVAAGARLDYVRPRRGRHLIAHTACCGPVWLPTTT